jgi:hypothetical protein
MAASFGTTAQRTFHRLVEETQKLASPPASSSFGRVAREEIRLVVGGVEVTIEVERRELPGGGAQAFWRCPRCDRLRYDLYIVDGALACRVCHGLDYRSRHMLHPAVVKAAKLRQRLGAEPGMLGRLPPRPKHNKKAERYDRLVLALAKEEATLMRMLDGIVSALKRRKGRLHGPR